MNSETGIRRENETEISVPHARRRTRTVLMLAAPAIVLLGALYVYLMGGRTESTENASLQTGIVAVSPSVAGKVVAIEVAENQRVKKGQVLFRINPDNYLATAAEAEAVLAGKTADVQARQADYQQALSELRATRARAAYAQSEAERQKSLVKEGISSRAQYDLAIMEAHTAHDAIASAEARANSLRARLAGNVSGAAEQNPDVRQAAANLDKEKIALGDTVVRAPQDGIVTRVNQLQVGNFVQPGRPVFMLTGTRFWVQANFKENQLRYMRVGQPVKIKIDAYPDAAVEGHVESFSPGTGTSFSILPAENATGNWVKVVQRLPVQIAIDKAPAHLPLSTGLSVEATVDTGHRRHLFGPDTAPYSSQVTRAQSTTSH